MHIRLKIQLTVVQNRCWTYIYANMLYTIFRCSSVPECWVKWRSSVMNVFPVSWPGCKHGLVVTLTARLSRNCKSNVLPLSLYNAHCVVTWSCVPGHGGNCGRRSSLCSTLLVWKIKLPWVLTQSLEAKQINCENIYIQHCVFTIQKMKFLWSNSQICCDYIIRGWLIFIHQWFVGEIFIWFILS